MIQMLCSKIEELTITRASLECKGSITLDPELIKIAGLVENQVVDVNNLTNGARSKTYILKGEKGDVQINGALSHLMHVGDKIHVNAYCWGMPEKTIIISREQAEEILRS